MSPQVVEFSLPTELIAKFPPTRCYLIGVSGGRDSVALLHGLTSLGYQRLIVCHLDHRLRGRSSNADAKFVKALATKLNLQCEIARTNVAALARRSRQSIETAGRNARYDFFARMARRRRCRTVFLGHHADDLVETFLINLFRGAGTTGLSGMREIATRSIGKVALKIVRPLLGVWRGEIDEYVRTHHIKFREDATNQSLIPLRNRVRRQIIPFLEKQFGRPIRKSVWRAASIASEEEGFFEELLPPDLTRSTQLAVEPLRAIPVAGQRRLVHDWLRAGHVATWGVD